MCFLLLTAASPLVIDTNPDVEHAADGVIERRIRSIVSRVETGGMPSYHRVRIENVVDLGIDRPVIVQVHRTTRVEVYNSWVVVLIGCWIFQRGYRARSGYALNPRIVELPFGNPVL